MLIEEYIKENFGGCKAKFARHIGKNPQQVTRWVNEGWIVIDHVAYSKRWKIEEVKKKD
jgi:hypothetical protein